MSTLQTKGLRSKRRNFPYISQVYVVASRAAEKLAGAQGKFFLRGHYLKNFSGKNFFPLNILPPPFFGQCTILGVKKFSGRVRCNYFPGPLSHFLCQISVLSPKNRYLVLCAEIFNTQKRLGPTKIFPGPPATRAPGQFAPPPLSAALVASLYHATKACSCYYGIRSHFIFAN